MSRITTLKIIIASLILIVLLIFSEMFLLTSGNSNKADDLLVVGAYLILAVNLFLVSLQIRVKAAVIGSVIVLFSSFTYFLLTLFLIEDIGEILYILQFIYIAGLSIVLRGFHMNALFQARQNHLLKFVSKISEIVYFEIDSDKDCAIIDFSYGFMDKYHLTYHHLEISNDEFFSYVHLDDVDELKKRSSDVSSIYGSTAYFRIKYPGMKSYCWMFSRIYLDEEGNLFGVDTDITTLHNLRKNLNVKEHQLANLEKDQRYILDNTKDLIAKIKPDGKIIYATKSFADFFPLEYDEIIGNNIVDINATVGIEDNEWLENLKEPPFSNSGMSLMRRDNQVYWMSWKNDAVLNAKGEIEFIVIVGHDITEIKNLNKQLKFESTHDSLTGLLNRRGLEEIFSTMKIDEQVVAFFIELNDFNIINDYYGHRTGDEVIKRLTEDLRLFEKQGCTLCRLSGDDILLIYASNKMNQRIEQLKEGLSHFEEMIYTIDEVKITLRMNIGYALYPEDTDDIKKLISLADLAMTESKNNQYKNCIRYESYMSQRLQETIVMINELKEAIDNKVIDVHFQPIIDVVNQKTPYLESLVRWKNKKQWVSPVVLFKLAREAGLLIKLDLYIINKALNSFSQLKHKKDYQDTVVAINVTPQTLLKDNFPSLLKEIIKKHHIQVDDVCIEISEETFVNNLDICKKQISTIKEMGIKIALDDFGRKYSSLAILDTMDFDIIKIDKLFVDNIESKNNIEIIKMILNISRFSNKIVIAEGIETKKQIDKLILLGCHLHQGFYYGKPKKII